MESTEAFEGDPELDWNHGHSALLPTILSIEDIHLQQFVIHILIDKVFIRIYKVFNQD